jgi:hypothetical protein
MVGWRAAADLAYKSLGVKPVKPYVPDSSAKKREE